MKIQTICDEIIEGYRQDNFYNLEKSFSKLYKYIQENKGTHIDTEKYFEIKKVFCYFEENYEYYLAQNLLTSPTPKDYLKLHERYVGYKVSISKTLDHILNYISPQKICFVGSGPLPITPIIIAENDIQTTGIEKNKDNYSISNEVLKKINPQNNVQIKNMKGSDFDSYGNYDVVFIEIMMLYLLHLMFLMIVMS
ncbi:nicotianamine synthase family protein [Candidatus Absconditicoccus praedator]|uniref:nicotianamine synthase family protein n=1 Tax=Candidatus Absconditicoccus praedator TaxID=2735562 RepID=UPI001E2DE071|nr:nicotianamine synthase family protein [Candidatus Absconditicoccus praedator]UFX82582.1 hypothetical protein HLG78_00315 [Candidatus Absconditicoccus praedator]